MFPVEAAKLQKSEHTTSSFNEKNSRTPKIIMYIKEILALLFVAFNKKPYLCTRQINL